MESSMGRWMETCCFKHTSMDPKIALLKFYFKNNFLEKLQKLVPNLKEASRLIFIGHCVGNWNSLSKKGESLNEDWEVILLEKTSKIKTVLVLYIYIESIP